MSEEEWRSNRVAYLREKSAKIAALPNPEGATLRCKDCGETMNIRQGARSKVWFIVHPKSRCEHSDDLSRVEAPTRAEAIAKWEDGE